MAAGNRLEELAGAPPDSARCRPEPACEARRGAATGDPSWRSGCETRCRWGSEPGPWRSSPGRRRKLRGSRPCAGLLQDSGRWRSRAKEVTRGFKLNIASSVGCTICRWLVQYMIYVPMYEDYRSREHVGIWEVRETVFKGYKTSLASFFIHRPPLWPGSSLPILREPNGEGGAGETCGDLLSQWFWPCEPASSAPANNCSPKVVYLVVSRFSEYKKQIVQDIRFGGGGRCWSSMYTKENVKFCWGFGIKPFVYQK
jgi:hypothetical protein